jgi:hypothetical protein
MRLVQRRTSPRYLRAVGRDTVEALLKRGSTKEGGVGMSIWDRVIAEARAKAVMDTVEAVVAKAKAETKAKAKAVEADEVANG